MRSPEQIQKDHYDQISELYNEHYSDRWSLEYRERFIHTPLFENIDFSGLKVLDAMCGNGDVSIYLSNRGAEVTGLDISEKQISVYTERCGCPGKASSIMDSGFPSESFDVVAVLGGLHHLPPHLDEAILEIHRLLKPGGIFCFSEPHGHSILESLRQWWYRWDPLFEENEQAIDLDRLTENHRSLFQPRLTKFLGGPAYLLVLNSLVFRIPQRLKAILSPGLLRLELLMQPLFSKRLSLFVVSQWQKV